MTPELCSCFDVYKLKDAVLKVALKDYNDKSRESKRTDSISASLKEWCS